MNIAKMQTKHIIYIANMHTMRKVDKGLSFAEYVNQLGNRPKEEGNIQDTKVCKRKQLSSHFWLFLFFMV